MKSVFNQTDVAEIKARINRLTPQSQPLWGKMTVAQMLAHLNVIYEMVYTDKHPRPNAFMRFVLKTLVKKMVVGPAPYKRNSPTATALIIKDDKNFEAEKDSLLSHLDQTQQLGETHFDNKESHSFGRLTAAEWNISFYKHLDHHLVQFGV